MHIQDIMKTPFFLLALTNEHNWQQFKCSLLTKTATRSQDQFETRPRMTKGDQEPQRITIAASVFFLGVASQIRKDTERSPWTLLLRMLSTESVDTWKKEE